MPRSAETASFKFNHTMLRVKDPKVSLAFYQDVIGMDLLSGECPPDKISLMISHLTRVTVKKFDDFTLYFLAFNHEGRDLSPEEKEASRFAREGQLISLLPSSQSNFDLRCYSRRSRVDAQPWYRE
ncbi:glyoxalase I, variant 3 [Coprinopsis cinerea AmutBmut pab1-1]|nr:glyoxalase I, variant 3 [Coprinopsis cinerea AmutBmut pab1-1]